MRRIVELGFTDVHEVGRILLTGAMVVVPVWLALRLLDSAAVGDSARPARCGERPVNSGA